jgi:Leucine-rich repeat (LRR) protein
VPPETTAINMSGHDIQSLKDLPAKLILLPNLQHLDLSNNRIQSLNVCVL